MELVLLITAVCEAWHWIREPLTNLVQVLAASAF